jgi:septum formation protein
MEPIILASSSIRRQEILRQLGFPFTVMTPRIDESFPSGMNEAGGVEDISRRKVESVLGTIADRFLPWVLGADTLIFLDGRPIGKPESREEAAEILSSLSGREHSVFTGVALYSGKGKRIIVGHDETTVSFKRLDDAELDAYLDIGEWQGAAGGYKIQGRAAFFIERIEGSYHSVMGLPIYLLYDMLKTAGYPF